MMLYYERGKKMKRKIISVSLFITLVMVMVSVAFTSVNALTMKDITDKLEKKILQDFTGFQPYGNENIWYNTGFAETPACDAEKGFYFTEVGTENNLGVANVKIKKLQTNDCSKAKYLTVKFQKNSVPKSFQAIFSFDVAGGWGWVGLYGSGDPNVYYDNGGKELSKASYTVTSDNNKELKFEVGSSDMVMVYIPVSSIKMPNGADAGSQLFGMNSFGIQFTDLGNKGTAVANKDAVSIREMAMYISYGADDEPTPSGDSYTKGFEETVLQDFKSSLSISTQWPSSWNNPGFDVWYNSDLTNLPALDQNGKGMYISDTGAKVHGKAGFKVMKFTTNDLTDAKYLAITFKKNGISGSFKINISFVMKGDDVVLNNSAPIYYDNGSAEMKKTFVVQETNAFNRFVTFETGSSGVVKAYIPLTALSNPYTGGIISADQIKNVNAVSLDFADLGNKENASIANSNAVSVRKISMYKPIAEKVIPDDETPAGDAYVEKMSKAVVQDFQTALNVGVAWPASFENPGIDLWYNIELTNTPAFSKNKGLYFTDDGMAQAHGNANFQIFRLQERDFSLARYVVFTFRKNELSGSFKTIFSFVISGKEDIVLADKTKVMYDNGSTELKEAVVTQVGDQFNRQLTFETGTANVIKAYVPVSALRHAYSGREMPLEKYLTVNSVGVKFVDLGNSDNAELSNANAVSLKEIAIYNYNGGNQLEVPNAPTTDAKELVKGLYHLEHQNFSDFKNYKVKNGLYNGDIALVGSASVAYNKDKGLYFKNGGTPLAVGIQALKTSDFASVKYIAVTFQKNDVTGAFRAKFNFAKKPGRCGNYDISMFYGTDARVYYDNGSGIKTAVPDIDDMMTFEIGNVKDVSTVTVYIPTEYLYSKYDALGNTCTLRKITSEDLVNINSVVISFADIGNRGNAALTNEKAISIKNISTYLLQNDEVVLPTERIVLQDFKNVNMDLLYQDPSNTNKMTPVLKNGELSLQSDKGHFDLVVADLMTRSVTGIEYLAVTIRFKEATSLQLGVSFECETGNYGTGNNKIGTPVPYYIDDGFRIRKVNTPNVGGGTWVGPIISKPFNQDEVTLYLPMTSIFNDEDGVEGIGKLFFKNIHISSGWARSIDWIDENVDNPAYLWKLEDAFSITKIEALGSNFMTKSTDHKALGATKVIKDFSKVDTKSLEFDLDNAEASVEPNVRNSALWFDNLMERFEPESYIIDMYNTDIKTSDFTGADYLAVNLRGSKLGSTSYFTLSIEDENSRPFDYWGDNVYLQAENGEIYKLPYDGRVAINHQQYGLNVTALFPMEFFQLSIFYLEDDYSPIDLTKIDCVHTGLYYGKSLGRLAISSIALIGNGVKPIVEEESDFEQDSDFEEETEYENTDYEQVDIQEIETVNETESGKSPKKIIKKQIVKKIITKGKADNLKLIILIVGASVVVLAVAATSIIICKRKRKKKSLQA